MAGGEKTNVRGKAVGECYSRGSLPSDLHSRRPGSKNERLQSCGFSDLCV